MFFIVFLLFSCQQNVNNTNSSSDLFKDVTSITVDNTSLDDYIILDDLLIVDSIEFIPLQTSSAILMGSPLSLQQINDGYLIVDANSNLIFYFTNEGRFIKYIGNIGKGPGEYLDILDVKIVPNYIQILNNNGRIITYSIDDNSSSEITVAQYSPLKFIASSQSDSLILFSNFDGNVKNSNNRLHVVSNNKLIKSFLPFKNTKSIFPITSHQFWERDGKFSFFETFSPIVYDVSYNEIRAKYKFMFEDLNPTVKGLEQPEMYFENKEENIGYRFFSEISETENYFFVSYSENMMRRYTLCDKRSLKSVATSLYGYNIKELGLTIESSPFVQKNTNTVIIAMDPSSILSAQNTIRNANISPKYKNVAEKILRIKTSIHDNPVLMKLTFDQ